MKISELKEILRDSGVCNTHGILKRFGVEGRDIAVLYFAAESRRCRPNVSCVYSPSHKTDPGASWYDYGQKTFTGRRAESMPRALAWVAEVYGVTEWGTSPFGQDKIPKEVLKRVREWAVIARSQS